MSEYIRHQNREWLISNLYALSNDVENEHIRKEFLASQTVDLHNRHNKYLWF